MPHPSRYHAQDGRVFTPTTFIDEYNKHPNLPAAAAAMRIEPTRLTVIASRLRRRGLPARFHGNQHMHGKIG